MLCTRMPRLLGADLVLTIVVILRLITGKLGDGLLRAVIVHQRLAGSGGGDQRSDGGVVEGTRQPSLTLCSRAVASSANSGSTAARGRRRSGRRAGVSEPGAR